MYLAIGAVKNIERGIKTIPKVMHVPGIVKLESKYIIRPQHSKQQKNLLIYMVLVWFCVEFTSSRVPPALALPSIIKHETAIKFPYLKRCLIWLFLCYYYYPRNQLELFEQGF